MTLAVSDYGLGIKKPAEAGMTRGVFRAVRADRPLGDLSMDAFQFVASTRSVAAVTPGYDFTWTIYSGILVPSISVFQLRAPEAVARCCHCSRRLR